jgi:parallel beta-helix repeat protein
MIRNSGAAGIYATGSGTATATISCNTFTANQNGIYWTASSAPAMSSNNFSGNTNYGIYYSGSTTMDAENNWWGDAAGPNQSGDATYGDVDADPWSESENQCVATGDNQSPNEPNTPDPEDGVVRVTVSNGVEVNWSGGDPDILDSVTYDIYWGTSADGLTMLVQDIGTTTYQVTDAVEGQTYYWQIIAKDNHEAQTSGPVWMFTTDGDLPDLMIGELTVDPPGNLQQDQTVTLTATIQNTGSGPVVDAFSVDFAINGVSIGTQPVDAIMLSGESTEVSLQWTYSGGDPTLRITVDDLLSVTETYENNNQYVALISEVADNTAPVLSSHLPLNNAQLQQLNQITFTLADAKSTVDDAAVMAGFSLIDPNQQPISGTISESDDTFTFIPASLPLTDGTFQVNVTSADTLGNQQVYPFSFVIDTQAPTKPGITGGVVASGTIQPRPATNQADDFMAPLEGTRDAGTSLWINGTQYLPAGADTWSVDLTLQQGDNALEIWCVDPAGNQSGSEWVDIYVEPAEGLIFDYNNAGRVKHVWHSQ